MINLLPSELKQNYRYGRRNVALRRWVVICLVALVGLGGLTTYGLLTIHQSSRQYSNQIASTQSQLQAANFAGTQAQVQDISNSFKLVVKVLGQEVLFSQLLKQIAAAIPPKATLAGLTINQTQGGIDITANAADYNTATQVQVNLADARNKIFSKADIVSITCDNANAADPTNPCKVTVRALFASNNPFLFINNKAAKP